MDRFKVTLTCPLPRKGFGSGDVHTDDEIKVMEDYLGIADGDIVVFPEAFMLTSNEHRAESLARKYKKWIICGTEDDGENKSLYTIVISPAEGKIYSHQKTSLTDGDRNNKAVQGKSIEALDTPFGKIGTVLCYEIHFPEVARIEAVEGARILFNTIGTGMWHEQQFDEWTCIAKARAIENRCFVLGCTHYCDPIPMMFAYDPHGRTLALKRNSNDMVTVEIDMDKIDERDFERDRNPKAYHKLIKEDIWQGTL